jgi:hypothetical protein
MSRLYSERGREMSKMKEWLLDRQENGDDGTGYCDMCAGCANCTSEGEGE